VSTTRGCQDEADQANTAAVESNGAIADMISTRPPANVDTSTRRVSLTLPDDEKQHSVGAVGTLLPTISNESDEHPMPTEDEKSMLRKVPATIPLVSFGLCLVEFAERASYYGAKTVFNNFIEFPLPKGEDEPPVRLVTLFDSHAGGNGAGAPPRGTQETAGALGMGLQASSALTLLFVFLAYVLPIFGGWLADVHTGKYKAIIYGVILAGVAHIIQIVGAIPSVLQAGSSHASPPFIIGLLILALGTGLFKPNIAPTILDQIKYQKAYIQVSKAGERVIVDPEATAQRVMLLFYGFVNVGAFFLIATSYTEKYVGYWAAFLESGCLYFLLPILLALLYSRTYKAPAFGSSDLTNAFRITGMALKQSRYQPWKDGFWDRAKASRLADQGIEVAWSDQLVEDVRRTIRQSHSPAARREASPCLQYLTKH
jgi:hypothetical protein